MTAEGGQGALPRLTGAQRSALLAADPATGRLTARAATCEALAVRGLAVRHGRSGHFAHYLTPAGRALRDRLSAAAPGGAPEVDAAGGSGTGQTTSRTTSRGTSEGAGEQPGEQTSYSPGTAAPGFHAATGHEVAAEPDQVRAAEVATALEGLREIRRLLGAGDTSAPAPWERARMVHAVALVLEGSGIPASAVDAAGRTVRTGFRVSVSDHQPDSVLVAWHRAEEDGPGTSPAASSDALAACARALEAYGWQPTRHSDRWGAWFLLVSPRHS